MSVTLYVMRLVQVLKLWQMKKKKTISKAHLFV